MSMLFIMYIPVTEPEAFSKDDEGSPSGRSKTVSVAVLYSRYLSQIHRTRSGTEYAAPSPVPDQPSSLPSTAKKQGLVGKETLKKLVTAAPLPKIATGPEPMPQSPDAAELDQDKGLVTSDSLEGQMKVQSDENISESNDEGLDVDSGSVNSKSPERESTEHEPKTLRQVVMKILSAEGITNTTWRMTENLHFWKVTFVADSVSCDLVLNSLITFGFGKITGTSIHLFPSSYYSGGEADIAEKKTDALKLFDEKSEFAKSIKARLTVAQVLGAVKANACITFDFIVLIIAASIIAALGLAENSSVQLVASMLISPLMGPTIGITFGICIKSSELWKMAVRSECIGLGLCIVFGYIFGLITAAVSLNGAVWGGTNAWPTFEMSNRGDVHALWVGALTATASGLGVALSVLGGNVGSLVGVAISASILPPAVNAGILWGLATIWSIYTPAYDYNRLAVGEKVQKLDASCPFLKSNEYMFIYTCNIAVDVLIVGCVSILLTILNVFCIFIVAIAVLKIKEVAPHVDIITAKTATDVFWRTDIPMVRNQKRVSRGADLTKMAAQFAEEYKALKTDAEKKQHVQKWRFIIGSLMADPVYNQATQHLTQPLPEIFRRLSSADLSEIDPLTDSAIAQYRNEAAAAHSSSLNPLTLVRDVGSRVWNLMPFTGKSDDTNVGGHTGKRSSKSSAVPPSTRKGSHIQNAIQEEDDDETSNKRL